MEARTANRAFKVNTGNDKYDESGANCRDSRIALGFLVTQSVPLAARIRAAVLGDAAPIPYRAAFYGLEAEYR